ncbi:diguanylate cyclase [Roseimaritima sediminicola]|uniref:diguanylate cyclase n=1 Tax=Roseimaritima sediminicola TaxID=2662066 RepID=UPI00129837E4|nr:diguanylate cyclase [Roseimaritima sediminicola]
MLEFFFALLCALSGLAAGFILRGSIQSPPPADDPAAPATPNDEPFDQATVNHVAQQLRTLTARVAADVDEHHSQVQKASNALCDTDAVPSPESIVATVADLIAANQAMQTKLEQAQDRIQAQAEKIQTVEQMAKTDALTKVCNRGALDEVLEQCHADPAEQPCSLMLADVDHFKQFNDTYGHLAGDHVLIRVAAMLSARLSGIATVARYGGEEFAIVFRGRDIAACRHQAELARRAVGEREILFENRSLRVNLSAGIAELRDGDSVLDWIKRADTALYRSKQSGRDCAYWMDEDEPRPLVDTAPGAGAMMTLESEIAEEERLHADSQRLHADSQLGKTASGPAVPGASPTAANLPAAADLPAAASRLPDERQLREHFGRLVDRLANVNVELYVVAIHCDQNAGDEDGKDHVLKVIRATTRSLDYLGQTAAGDLLICMPAANEDNAVDRAERICSGVQRLPLVDGKSPPTVSIGLACVAANDSFDAVSELASATARRLHQEGGNRLAVAPAIVSA